MKNHIFWLCALIRGLKGQNMPFFSLLLTSEVDFRSKKWIKYQNNVRNVFRNIKLPLGNDMGHWNGIFWSLWKKVQKKYLDATFWGGKKQVLI